MVKVKSLKVAFFHPDLGIGGAERLVLDIAIALSEQGLEVVFFTNHFDSNHAFEELKSDKYVVRVVGDWIPRSVCGFFQAFCAYVRMLWLSLIYVIFLRYTDQADVFIVDQIPMAIPILKWTKKKVIYYCHHPDLLASSPGGALKRLYRKPIDYIEFKGTDLADEVLVNSKYTANVIKKTFPGLRKELKIVYPTISAAYQASVKKISKKPMKSLIEDLKHTESEIFFLSINRFHSAKKLDIAINALSALRTKVSLTDFDKVHLILAGGYDPNSYENEIDFKMLTKLASKKNLENKITFLKSPSDKLKAELLVACNCLLYTPVNEHFGIVPLEAMAAGRPVIACNSGGPRETVDHEVTGFLCKPEGDSFSDAMLKIFDRKAADRMGENGRKRLEMLFTYNTFSKSVLDVTMKNVCALN